MTSYLHEKDWNRLIEANVFQHVADITPEMLRELNVRRFFHVKTDKKPIGVPYDRHRWSRSDKSELPRHRPHYKKVVVQGCPTHAIRCTSIHNKEFRKEVLHLEHATYYHYFLTGEGVYTEPEEAEIQKPRISDGKRVRELLIENGTSANAYEIAQNEGIQVTKKQCQNQLRTLREQSASAADSPKEKPAVKKKRKITLEQLNLLKNLFPDDVTAYTDDNNHVLYQIKLFATGKIDPSAQTLQDTVRPDSNGLDPDFEFEQEYSHDEPHFEIKQEEPDAPFDEQLSSVHYSPQEELMCVPKYEPPVDEYPMDIHQYHIDSSPLIYHQKLDYSSMQ